ncbi:hypothetical protein HMI54_000320 [Coelomomyces lativittatus]|nr:hypothetical protein HMI56_003076 [Coelomomyces lativittatus]KAJ1518473.1 hypothetical protein HMI54_000320 [Coelomomyces lativittatus]
MNGVILSKTETAQVQLGSFDNKTVALKTLYSKEINLEIELLQLLSKKKEEDPLKFLNIIGIRDIMQKDGNYILMFDAYSEVQLFGLSLVECALHLRELLRGLSAIHSLNIAHLDVNPSNLVINQDRQWVLIDFGLARICDNKPHPPGRGTQGYIAPELYPPDTCSSTMPDIYSAGIIFGQMLEPFIPYSDLRILGGMCCFPSHVEKIWYELLEFVEIDGPCNDDLFPSILQSAADLFLRLTAKISSRHRYMRLSAQEALLHSFLTFLDHPHMVDEVSQLFDSKTWKRAKVRDQLMYRKRRRGMEVSRIIGA